MGKLVRPADVTWLEEVLLPFLKLEHLTIVELAEYGGEYPDIWCSPAAQTITVTLAWARKPTRQRRIELTHEGIHLAWGWEHGGWERARGYYSRPERDTFSRILYDQQLREKH